MNQERIESLFDELVQLVLVRHSLVHDRHHCGVFGVVCVCLIYSLTVDNDVTRELRHIPEYVR